MTPLRLDDPLAHLRGIVGLSHRALGQRVRPRPVSDAAVVDAEQRGPRIKLSTLAAYARAAGYTLWLRVERGEYVCLRCAADDLAVGVCDARALLAALGLEMTLAVEPVGPVEGSGR